MNSAFERIIATVVLAAMLLLSGNVFGMGSGRESSRRNVCINNLRQIDAAKDQYSLEYGGDTGSTITWASVSMYVKDITNKVYCPHSTEDQRYFTSNYVVNTLGTDPECSVVGMPGGHSLKYPHGYVGPPPPPPRPKATSWMGKVADTLQAGEWTMVLAPLVVLLFAWVVVGIAWRAGAKEEEDDEDAA